MSELTVQDFKVNDRVFIHPASDLFMKGIKYATVVKVGKKWIHLRENEIKFKILPRDILGFV